MKTFNKKSLYAALAGVTALGGTGAAEAVSVNPDGLGQVLIYPYYTVREKVPGAPFNALLSVVNSTGSAKAVKVRFLEGKNSREVLDFNLYLSKKDVWTAAVLPTSDGAGIITFDKSCTTPTVSADPDNPTLFVNYQYSGSNADGADTSLDRTREGYVEIIEMGNIIANSPTEISVTHVSGVPACTGLSGTAPDSDTVAGNGGLFGSMTLINVLAGEDYGFDPVALESWTQTKQWTDPGSILPNLGNVNPKISVVTTGTNTYITDWSASTNGADPVSALFMHDNVYNEFVLDEGTRSGTDWVVTMPTKREYYTFATGAVQKLFQRNFTSSGACDDVVVTRYDREERTVRSSTSFSPPPPTLTDSLCWEANVITFENTNVLASKNIANIPTTFENGWVSINFQGASVPLDRHRLFGGPSLVFNTATGLTTTVATTTFNGLPVIGFAAITYNNGTLDGGEGRLIQSQYGGNFSHKTTRSIVTGLIGN